MADIVERLRSSEALPACPYDKLSPHYLTAPNDKPCAVCGGLNDPDAPDLCRGADTRIMGEAANEIERLNTRVTNLTYALERMKHGAEYCDELGDIIDAALTGQPD